jgi:hypothetical protein
MTIGKAKSLSNKCQINHLKSLHELAQKIFPKISHSEEPPLF